ncbi:MAG: PIN domain-containing protein [Gammaproteobacteria bacterium]|nr:PIN domain-containing protein [Gammaproteobacteria bacterium]
MSVLVDANLLLYAYDSDSPHHPAARRWLEAEISSGTPIRLALVTLLAFVRIASDRRVFVHPRSPADACAIIETWLAASNVRLLNPGPRTWAHLARICDDAQAHGPLVMDAHLAALALEHGATVATSDKDFRRFNGI